jgi:hypothetical protein
MTTVAQNRQDKLPYQKRLRVMVLMTMRLQWLGQLMLAGCSAMLVQTLNAVLESSAINAF